jgi:hypothetical protein
VKFLEEMIRDLPIPDTQAVLIVETDGEETEEADGEYE